MTVFKTNSGDCDAEISKEISKHKKEGGLSISFIGGIFLYDLFQNKDWVTKVFNKKECKQYLKEICDSLMVL